MRTSIKVLMVLGVLLLILPPVIGSLVLDHFTDYNPSGAFVDNTEGLVMALVTVPLMLLGMLLLVVAGAIAALGSKRGSGEEYTEEGRPLSEHHRRPASELGHQAGHRWICSRHHEPDCPICVQRVSVWDISPTNAVDRADRP